MGRLCAIALFVGGCSFALPGPASDRNDQPGSDAGGDAAPSDTAPSGPQTTDHLANADTWLHSQFPNNSSPATCS